jgi:hypothetical protein
MKLAEAKEAWFELCDIPIDDQNCIEESFRDFKAGTDQEEIREWFEETYEVNVVRDLMNSE